jgi:hypothetical protein
MVIVGDKFDIATYTNDELLEIVGSHDPQEIEAILIEKMKSYMYSRLTEDIKMFTFLKNIYTHFFDAYEETNVKTDDFAVTLRELEKADFEKADAMKAKTKNEIQIPENVYDVSNYTITDLLRILDLSDGATEREKEAKLIQNLQLYKNVQTDQGKKMFTFYSELYLKFFSELNVSPNLTDSTTTTTSEDDVLFQNQTNVSNAGNVNYTQTLDYTKGKINPILKETYKRIISIDSQYRDAEYASATNFTLNITETLKDVVSLKLYAVQIPVTWYTISNAYGSNYFYLKPINAESTLGIYNNSSHEYRVEINPGNYTQTTLTAQIQNKLQELGNIYKDVSFGSTSYKYDKSDAKSTLTIDIQKVYNESYYDMIIGPTIKSLLKIDDLPINTFYSQRFSTADSFQYKVDNNNNTLVIEHYYSSTIIKNIHISLDISDNITIDSIINDLNQKLKNNLYLSNSSSVEIIGDDGNYMFKWNIRLNRYETQNIAGSKIRLTFPNTDEDPNNIAFGKILWQDGFRFTSSSPIEITKYTSYENVSTEFAAINNETIIFRPKVDVSGGVYIENSTANDIIISITPGNYNTTSLVEHINMKIGLDPLLAGTTFSTVTSSSGSSVVMINFNINKVYTTKDYRIVFYDIYSFAKCTKASNSYRNATADTTLGYILGYQDLVEYNLIFSNLSPTTGMFLRPDGLQTSNVYTIKDMSSTEGNIFNTIATLKGDAVLSIYLYNYFMIILDDFNQNHLNDGLVTVSKRDTSVTLPSYANRKNYRACDNKTEATSSAATSARSGLTEKQVYSVEQIIATQNKNRDVLNAGPFIKDMFALLPIKASGVEPGTIYVEFGGTLQQQERVYFGPVNINRLMVQLINDKGDVVDLNGANWSFQLVCEQLYQKGGELI